MTTTTINLSWFCAPLFVAGLLAIMITAAIFQHRAALNYGKRIAAAQRRGAFADMQTPEYKSRYRWLGLIAFLGTFGAIASLGMIIIRQLGLAMIPPEIDLLAFGILGTIGATAGILMKREIDRRL